MATVFNANYGSGESALPWINLILGSIDRTVEGNRERKDAAAIVDWQKSGMQGPMPVPLSDRYRGLWLTNAANQGQTAQEVGTRNTDIGSMEDYLQKLQVNPLGSANEPNPVAFDASAAHGPIELQPLDVNPLAAQPAMVSFPAMRSGDIGKEMQARYAASMLGSALPMSPLERARLENEQAQTKYYGAQADALYAKPTGKEYEPIILENASGQQVAWSPETKALPPGGPWKRVGSPTTVVNVGEGAREKTASMETQLTAIQDLDAAFTEATKKAQGSAVGATGWLAGPIQENLGKVGLTSPEQEQLLAKVASLQNTILQARSGVAISPTEAERVQRETPTMNDSPVRFRAKLEQTKQNLIMLQQKRREQGLDVAGAPAPAPAAKVPVTAPDGKVYMVPPDKVEATKKLWGIP